jgi:uncharacterized protein YkwD
MRFRFLRLLLALLILCLLSPAFGQVPAGKATGLVFSPNHLALPSALDQPGAVQRLLQGSPASYDLSPLSGGVYDQLGYPRCSSFSMAAIKSYLDREEHGQWYWFDAVTLFHEGGGSDVYGGANEWMEQVAISSGCLRSATGQRYKDLSFAQAPSVPGVFEATIQAAVSSGKPVHLAVLLPYQFGWDSNENVNPFAYHALAIVGYDPTYVIVQNSWGPDWGNRGFGRLRWSYLTANNFQQGYCYGLVPTDAPDPWDPNGQIPPLIVPPGPPPVPAPSNLSAAAQRVLDLTNQARGAAGLRTLVIDSRLQKAAQAYAELLNTGIPFSHSGPDGSTPFSRMQAAGYDGGYMGENIARGFFTADDVFTAWRNSPGHWANILYPNYDAVGIGVAGSSWVQDFGGGGSTPKPAPTPTPTPTPRPTPTPTPVPTPTPPPTPKPVPAPVPVPVPTPIFRYVVPPVPHR